MEISTADDSGVLVLGFSGSLDTATFEQAEKVLQEVIADGKKRVLCDFAALDYISSAGLRVLLKAAKGLATGGGELRLCNLNEVVGEVFEISGFSSILNVFEHREGALEGF
jgi:anti-sigma B factor antagonist